MNMPGKLESQFNKARIRVSLKEETRTVRISTLIRRNT